MSGAGPAGARPGASPDPGTGEGDSKKRRLFFALDPDEALRAHLNGALRPMLASVGGRHVPAQRLHLTLVFLGEIAPAAIPCVRAAAGRVRGEPFQLTLDRIGCWRRAEILWLAPRPCAALDALHAALRAALAPCGIALEERTFRPHVTLVRKLRQPHPPAVIEPPLVWEARDYALMESGEAGYRTLATWSLG